MACGFDAEIEREPNHASKLGRNEDVRGPANLTGRPEQRANLCELSPESGGHYPGGERSGGADYPQQRRVQSQRLRAFFLGSRAKAGWLEAR